MDRDDLLVLGQAAGLVGVLAPGRPRWCLPATVTLAACGAAVAGGALAGTAASSHGRLLTPRVRPRAGATLLREGPYRISRHPLYAGLVLACAGVAVLQRRAVPLAALVGLAAVLRLKTAREEVRLVERFGGAYEDYRRTTPWLLGRPRDQRRSERGSTPR